MLARRISALLLCAGLFLLWPTSAAQSEPQLLGTLDPEVTLYAVGELEFPGEFGWYEFRSSPAQLPIVVIARGFDADLGLRVLLADDEGAFVASSEIGYLRNSLRAGTYRLRVDSVTSEIGDYELLVSSTVESESNDGLVEANRLGSAEGGRLAVASLLPPADADFFRFEIPESSTSESRAFVIETQGPTESDTTLVLYRFDTTEQRFLPSRYDDDSGAGLWSRLVLRAEPGEYALRIEETGYNLEGIDEYHVTIAPRAVGVDAEPNNSPSEAAPLEEAGSDAFMVDGLLTASDAIDTYSLVVERPVLLQLWTEEQPGLGDHDTILTLHTADGGLLAENDDSGDQLWSHVAHAVDEGRYVVQVEAAIPRTPFLPYRLRATTLPATSLLESEANDTPQSAQELSIDLGEALLISGSLDVEDVDVFRVVLDEETELVLVTGPEFGSTADQDTTLALLDAEMNEVAYNDDSTGSWSRVETVVPSGTYYIAVTSYWPEDTFAYTLTVSKL